ncbi:FkbM family methyltransferase [Runella aurantiaca]|uniref:FkbM family methyltransferase n=1 Tax=Runella aurantiaca TaxID=2282308 RepID=A0A369I942_9BACT|nr:FkbM family methyltransferase [Runella aurantiaca]RDB06279.1 FkbM family methyltransferase [Runella aurantiaca]
MKNNLIYDIGMHLGYDTQMYLDKGYNVIAVEANTFLVGKAKKKMSKPIENNRLQILNFAISEIDSGVVPFYISINKSIQSSLEKNMAERGSTVLKIEVNTTKLSTLFQKYGVPYYCKIDIEGYDYIALKSLQGFPSLLPKFISAEINNISNEGHTAENISSKKELYDIWLSILTLLKQIGYTKFKVIDQSSLQNISNSTYIKNDFLLKKNIYSKINKKALRIKECLSLKKSFNLGYFKDCSGPFGEYLEGEWLDFEITKDLIMSYGNTMLKHGIKTMWCDIHATY